MKFQCKNLGPISEATLDIKPLTVIAGKNQSGKSYITKMIYSMLRGSVKKLKDENPNMKTDFESFFNFSKVADVFQANEPQELINHLQEIKSSTSILSDAPSPDKVKLIINNKGIEEFSTTLLLKNNLKINFLSSPVILDLEKAVSVYKEVYPNNFGVSDIYWDFIKDIRNIGQSRHQDKELLIEIQEIVGGKYIYETGKGFSFVQNNNSYQTNLVAFGVKFFGMIYLLMERGLLEENDYLIIEEPENHLHPAYQLKMIELLIHLAKKKRNIIITTHSPEIIRAIENSVNSGKISLDECSFLHMQESENGFFGTSASDMDTLYKISEDLTKAYYDLTVEGYQITEGK
ncbi:MAG: hypothetical protein A2Y33_07220 [Spirochaetes bacterium GWF1_51_8]|nr:MAG: hypothetical protein A2Y33_07220 [Spirochaetes bacterium GWF1_51_8]